MFALLKASFFKLKRDLGLRITLFIGLALAIILNLVFLVLDTIGGKGFHSMATGQNLLLNSFNPGQNFGIAIPINLAIFTIMEFSQGTIRNKVVVGNSKLKIYFSLLITGLLFTFALLISYVGLSTILGCIFGRGFYPNEIVDGQKTIIKDMTFSADYIVKYVISGCLSYITITSFTVFCGTLTRNIGPSIPLILIPIIFLTVVPMFTKELGNSYLLNLESAQKELEKGSQTMYDFYMSLANSFKGAYYLDQVVRFIDPFYIIGSQSILASLLGAPTIENKLFVANIVSNVAWTSVFGVFGALIFCKRDLK